MPSTGPTRSTVFAGPPSVIAQISLESEAFWIAAFIPPSSRTVQTPREPQRAVRRPGNSAYTSTGVRSDDVTALIVEHKGQIHHPEL